MKNHLKRITAPKTWVIDRKKSTFIVRPDSGAHSFDMGLPLGLIIRNVLGYANTMPEVKKLLNNNEVLVDGKRRKNHRFIVGLFDVISFPAFKKYHTVGLDQKGRLTVKDIKEEETKVKTCKVVGKKILNKGKIQLNLHDGKNLFSENSIKVGDSVVVNIPKLKINKVLPLKEGALVLLTKGKHGGSEGKLEGFEGKRAKCAVSKENIETDRSYLFVVN